MALCYRPLRSGELQLASSVMPGVILLIVQPLEFHDSVWSDRRPRELPENCYAPG